MSGRRSNPIAAPRRGFTLIELLAVIGIIALLSTITVVAVARISDDSRLTSGVNAVNQALAIARSRAIRDNEPVGVFFVVDWDPARPDVRQRTQAVIARFTGDIYTFTGGLSIVDRFSPVPDVPPVVLPEGVKVAGPHYSFDGDDPTDDGFDRSVWGDYFWVTQPELQFTDAESPRFRAPGEFPGQMIAVLFGTDGRVMTNNPFTGSRELWLDRYPGPNPADGGTSAPDPQDVFANVGAPNIGGIESGGQVPWKWYDHYRDEPDVQLVPFLAVYDDDAARRRKFNDWSVAVNYRTGVSDFVRDEGIRIHFNRYSGTTMR